MSGTVLWSRGLTVYELPPSHLSWWANAPTEHASSVNGARIMVARDVLAARRRATRKLRRIEAHATRRRLLFLAYDIASTRKNPRGQRAWSPEGLESSARGARYRAEQCDRSCGRGCNANWRQRAHLQAHAAGALRELLATFEVRA